MCGRYVLINGRWVPRTLPSDPFYKPPPIFADSEPRYNVAPSQLVPLVTSDAPEMVQEFEWGFLPSWAADPSAVRPINARAETITSKPYFRSAFRKQRGLMLADGFYEWQTVKGQKRKTPYFIRLKSGEQFAFAALWDRWTHEGKTINSCAIITTTANEIMAPIHHRMPVILHPKDHALWLDTSVKDMDRIEALLTQYPAEEMTAHPVSLAVNNPRHDAPDCIEPA